MAIIKYIQEETTYVILTGRMRSLVYRESVGEKGKPMATFSVAYDWKKDDFDKPMNLYMNCVAWGPVAKYLSGMQDEEDRPIAMACGKLKTSEWRGEVREQVEVDFVQIQPTTIATVEEKKKEGKKEDKEFDDINF